MGSDGLRWVRMDVQHCTSTSISISTSTSTRIVCPADAVSPADRWMDGWMGDGDGDARYGTVRHAWIGWIAFDWMRGPFSVSIIL